MYQQDWKLYMPKSKMLHWIQIGGSILWRYVKMNLSGKVQRQKSSRLYFVSAQKTWYFMTVLMIRCFDIYYICDLIFYCIYSSQTIIPNEILLTRILMFFRDKFFWFKILMNVQKILIYVGSMENAETEMETITVTVNKALK